MISVVIVNFKTFEITHRTLSALLLSTNAGEFEVILVDNGSQDQSGEKLYELFPTIKYIPLPDNIGFARANNVAMKICNGNTILLLNSDVTVAPDALFTAHKTLWSDNSIGCVGAKLILPSGKLDHACHRGIPTPFNAFCYFTGISKLFPRSKRFGGYELSWLSLDETHEVDALTGAFMMIKKEVLDQIGLFDENYFMYGEDLDLCVRMKNVGRKIIFEPRSTCVHHKGGSSGSRPTWLIYEFYRAMKLFHRTHLASKTPALVNILTEMGISILHLIALTKRFLRFPKKKY